MPPWKLFIPYAQMKFMYDCEDLVMLNLEFRDVYEIFLTCFNLVCISRELYL